MSRCSRSSRLSILVPMLYHSPRTPGELRAVAEWVRRAKSASENDPAMRKARREEEHTIRKLERERLMRKLEQWGRHYDLELGTGAGAEHEDAARKLWECAQNVHLICKCCGAAKVAENRCKKRWCPVCAHKLAAAKVERYKHAVSRMEWPLFVTLTIPNEPDLKPMLRRMTKTFRKFRQREWWNRAEVAGGVAAIEITNNGNGWHVHLHAIMDCQWLAVNTPRPQRGCTAERLAFLCESAKHELNEAWSSVAGVASAITYVSRADKGTVVEALKYSVKPSDLIEMTGDPLPVIAAMYRVRAVIPFGSLHGIGAEFKALENEQAVSVSCQGCGGDQWLPAGLVAPKETPIMKPLTVTKARKMNSTEAAAAAKERELQRKYAEAMARKLRDAT